MNIIIDAERVSKRGNKCFHSGKKYQNIIYQKMRLLEMNGNNFEVIEVQGAKAGSDIQLIHTKGIIGFEVKTKGAFEGGSKKLYYNGTKMEIRDKCIHQTILGDTILYNGYNLPWYDNNKTIKAYNEVKIIFEKDIYLQADNNAVSMYYKNIGTYYIQIQGYGLYHTGEDILNLNVPYFSCPMTLRIRNTKHKKNGIPTDITAALQYDKRNLDKSPYNLDNVLPSTMKLLVVK